MNFVEESNIMIEKVIRLNCLDQASWINTRMK